MTLDPSFRLLVVPENANPTAVLNMLGRVFDVIQRCNDDQAAAAYAGLKPAMDALATCDDAMYQAVQDALDQACATLTACDQHIAEQVFSAIGCAQAICDHCDAQVNRHQAAMDRRERRRTMASDAAASGGTGQTAAIGSGTQPTQSASTSPGRTAGASLLNMASPWPPPPTVPELDGLILPCDQGRQPIVLAGLPPEYWSHESRAGLFLSIEPTPITRAILGTLKVVGDTCTSGEPIYLNLTTDMAGDELKGLVQSLGCLPEGYTLWSPLTAWNEAVGVFGEPITKIAWQVFGLTIPSPMAQPMELPATPPAAPVGPAGGTAGGNGVAGSPFELTALVEQPQQLDQAEPVQLGPGFAANAGVQLGQLAGRLGQLDRAAICAVANELADVLGIPRNLVPFCNSLTDITRWLTSRRV